MEVKYLRNATFSSSYVFGEVLKSNPEICRRLIETLLKIEVERIEYVKAEETMKLSSRSRGIRMDVFVKGSNKVFDIEMQTTREPALGKRARYYQSMMDGDILLSGQGYSDLKESYVIFICLEDPFPSAGLPIYTFERIARENPEVSLGDNTHIVFYNCSGLEKVKDEEIRSFLSYVRTNRAESAFTKEIDRMVDILRERDVSFSEYCAINLHNNDMKRRGKEEVASAMKTEGIDLDMIVKCTGLSKEEVLAL